MGIKSNRGGSRVGAGRPSGTTGEYKEIKKSSFIQIRVTEEEKQKLQELADKSGKKLSKFLLDLAFDMN